jgi:hypothetical protein
LFAAFVVEGVDVSASPVLLLIEDFALDVVVSEIEGAVCEVDEAVEEVVEMVEMVEVVDVDVVIFKKEDGLYCHTVPLSPATLSLLYYCHHYHYCYQLLSTPQDARGNAKELLRRFKVSFAQFGPGNSLRKPCI